MDRRDCETELRRRRREILVRLVRAFDGPDFPGAVSELPAAFAAELAGGGPADGQLLRELRERTVAALGFSAEEETGDLRALAERALVREKKEEYPLTALAGTCDRCPPESYRITDVCRNCTAHYCLASCRLGAITLSSGRPTIDPQKCKKCDQCLRACPYWAIVHSTVPCEAQCPVAAVGKGEGGHARIDFDRCISCGRCTVACPFGAIVGKSQLVDVLRAMASGREVIALYAPSWVGQSQEPAHRLAAALKKTGFAGSCEVARGAEETIRAEAEDFQEHLASGKQFLTTSCCAAYNEFRAKHLQEINPYVSKAGTPLLYTARLARREHPDAVLVFLSPCFAKYREVLQNPDVSHVLNFEEVDALFRARSVDVAACEGDPIQPTTAREAREFALSAGVARSVQAALGAEGEKIRPVIVNGLTKEAIKKLRRYATEGTCEEGNLIEVMACDGGCIGGSATLFSLPKAQRQVTAHSVQGGSIAKGLAATEG
ncbi:MAG: 4Fe-4S binding protein [Puniceicoccales bacterium]|jgi:[FeFe] hydrogenase (group B1/B3)|nr:4Fe-4S binding protein [Puniceicoccales bacterium]